MTASILKLLVTSLLVSIVIVVCSVLLGTENIPAVATDASSDLASGAELLLYFIKNPAFAYGVLAPIFAPLFLAAFVSALIVSIERGWGRRKAE